MQMRIAAERDPGDLVRRWPRVIIDEVQRVPGLMLAVKAVVDAERHATKGRFVLTGSATLLAMRQVADSLAGRAGYLPMAPMTRGELLGFGTTGRWDDLWDTPFDGWQDRLASNDAIPADWRELAQHGGFPVPALQLDDAARHEWFSGYAATYLERDLRAVSAVDSLGEFQRAMRAFAIRAGTPVNHADVARELGLVARTRGRRDLPCHGPRARDPMVARAMTNRLQNTCAHRQLEGRFRLQAIDERRYAVDPSSL